MKALSIFGTGSDAGKSTVTFVIGRLLQERGYSVAPFKAQNVSNNSRVTADGRELAIAQYFQARALGVEPVTEMNPVLLKSGKGNSAALLLNGLPVGDRDVRTYYRDIDLLKPHIDNALNRLSKQYDLLICEGAGSPVELNLMEKDLSNLYTSETTDAKVILVADIEKGGSFASIWGTINLLPEQQRNNLIGVIINKFRGDVTLYDEGITIIEERFGVPVLGVLPYEPLNLGFEDIQSLYNYRTPQNGSIKIGVVKFPHMSNFTDFEPLILDPSVELAFVDSGFDRFDMLILPGTKRTIYDLQWLKSTGIFDKISTFHGPILGICGGYQMLFETITDPHGIEDDSCESESGFAIVNDSIHFTEEKILRSDRYHQFGFSLEGYEIHHGVPVNGTQWFHSGNVRGTFLHGLLENDEFRTALLMEIDPLYKGYSFSQKQNETIQSFTNLMKESLNVNLIEKALRE